MLDGLHQCGSSIVVAESSLVGLITLVISVYITQRVRTRQQALTPICFGVSTPAKQLSFVGAHVIWLFAIIGGCSNKLRHVSKLV